MIEKVNPCHPDKVADRIAGAIIDLAYTKACNPKVATEVLIGHGVCHIICESSVNFKEAEIRAIVDRLAPNIQLDLKIVPQDIHLASNQSQKIKCGDNGIFKGMPLTTEQKTLSAIARDIFNKFPSDGKYILGSDMADSVTGGGLHGKDLSKADVSVNIYAFLKAQETNKPVELFCAIGDETIDGKPYSEIVQIAKDYIKAQGGFERFAMWGLY